MVVTAGFVACGQKGPYKISDADKNIILKTDAQLQLIQKEFSEKAQPIFKEQQETAQRVCKAAGFTLGLDCELNFQSGIVTKKFTPAPPTPTSAGKQVVGQAPETKKGK